MDIPTLAQTPKTGKNDGCDAHHKGVPMKRLKSRAWIVMTLAGGLVPFASAQDDGDKLPIRPPILGGGGVAAEQSPQEEMAELFREVESRMLSMGNLLLDASAGDTTKLSEVGESGIEDLLREARPQGASGGVGDLLSISKLQGDKVLSGIDRILEIAAQNGGT